MAEHVKFLFNTEWMVNIRKLKDREEQLDLFLAIMDYAETGTHSELPFESDLVIEPIKSEIGRYMAKYKEKCRKNQETATNREQKKREEAEELERLREEHKRAQSCTDVNNRARTSPPNPNPNPNPEPEPNPEPDVIKRDRQAISLSQETGDDTSKTIRKQKLLNNTEVKEVANYYNEQIKETGANFAQCINVDGQRASLISARIKQYGKENVKLAINKIFASKWIAENAKTSVRNITWIMKPENCRKILEGNYDNDKQPAPSTSQPKRHYDDNTSDNFKITEYWDHYNETH